MKKIKLAVSGDAGSFSEEAGWLYARQAGLMADLSCVIDMEGVLTALDRGEANLGIFPVVNSRGGLVQMAFSAMGRHIFELVDELPMEVNQCLLVLPGVKRNTVKQIASHPQALSQCARYLKKTFPRAKLVEWPDTAKAARDLSAGIIPADSAVIAPARSAELYGLEILARGIQDEHPNITTFIIVKK